MGLPTPLDELRRPHPDQARIDREAAAMLLRSAKIGPVWADRIGAPSDKPIDPGTSSPAAQPTRR